MSKKVKVVRPGVVDRCTLSSLSGQSIRRVALLMLREGWDVRNVVVIVPLRPYTAKAQILPEQTLGRGLRRMSLPASGIDEQVIVIEHEAFKPFWKNELEEEGLEVEWVPVDSVRPNFSGQVKAGVRC